MGQVIAKCSKGHVVRGTWEDVKAGWIFCGCGRPAVAKGFKPVHSEKKCGAVCQGATGPSCSCECGGENHGQSMIFTA